MLELRGVSKHFGGVAAVSDVSFALAEGEILGLMGANGAGKTTLFSLIAGNQKPSSGEIAFGDRRIDGLRPDQVSRLGIARVFQIVRPFASLTVLENAMIGRLYGAGRERSLEAAKSDARRILEELGLGGRADHPASSLTLAGRKRLEIARALAASPKLLLLDEVLAGLTPTEASEALDLIRSLQSRYRLTLIVIEHVMRALMRLCGRIVVVHHGAKIAEGAPGQIARDPAVIDAYLGKDNSP